MKITVVGTGKVGQAVTERLRKEGHNVVIIDRNADVINTMVDQFDVYGVVGNCLNYDVLTEAGMHNTDIFIAATSSDEINLLSCTLAKTLGAKETIARVRDPEYIKQIGFMREELGISITVNPEYATAREILNMIQIPNALKVETFADGLANLMELKLDPGSPLIGQSLFDIRQKYQIQILVCAIQRGDDVFIPAGDFVLAEGDKIHITGTRENLSEFFKALGILKGRIDRIMIIGGGRIGHYLCEMLLANHYKVKVIEIDKEKCLNLSSAFPKATIINADGTDQEILNLEGLNESGAVISLANIDEENIVISMYAQKSGVEKVIAKINRPGLLKIIESVGVASTITPKEVIADEILSYVRSQGSNQGNGVRTLYKLANEKIEALEFVVAEMPQKLTYRLKDLHIKEGILVAAIIRNNEVIIPNGFDKLELDDRVVIVTTNDSLNDLNDILE